MCQLSVATDAGSELLCPMSSGCSKRKPAPKARGKKSSMRRVIIESPFSSGTPVSIPDVVTRNVRYLRACMRACLLREEAPYASHGLYTQEGVLDDTTPSERTLGMEAGFAWLTGDVLSVPHTDLGISRGMQAGIDLAVARGIRVEVRRLGGYWAKCDPDVCSARLSGPLHAGPGHTYACPMWRAP